jgi:hypothetical protein
MDVNYWGMVGVPIAVGLAALALYKWRRSQRTRLVGESVKGFLTNRYGDLPKHLTIDCSDDALWPVLVAFDNPQTGARQRLQFDVRERDSTVSLRSEKEEPREAA